MRPANERLRYVGHVATYRTRQRRRGRLEQADGQAPRPDRRGYLGANEAPAGHYPLPAALQGRSDGVRVVDRAERTRTSQSAGAGADVA